jgi:hypothetical protein
MESDDLLGKIINMVSPAADACILIWDKYQWWVIGAVLAVLFMIFKG